MDFALKMLASLYLCTSLQYAMSANEFAKQVVLSIVISINISFFCVWALVL